MRYDIYIYIYICRTAPLTSRCCILYIYSTNMRTEYFKHAAQSPFFPLQNAVYFIMLPFFGRLFSAMDADCVHCSVQPNFVKLTCQMLRFFDLLNTRTVHFPSLYVLSLNLTLLPSFFWIIVSCSSATFPSIPSSFNVFKIADPGGQCEA